jgi:hypothetical protein
MIYLGLDDTDVLDSPGTNQLARHITRQIADSYRTQLIVRHQLLEDPRVPCTSKNGCASLLLQPLREGSLDTLVEQLREVILSWCPTGSDPGLCVAAEVPEGIMRWGERCQRELVTQSEARELAAHSEVYLTGLGGTEGGVIGALAAVGLLAARRPGRVIYLGTAEHDFFDVCGWQAVPDLRAEGIDEIQRVDSNSPVTAGSVDVGKRLRPNYHDGRVVLYVTPLESGEGPRWQAVRRR